MRVVERGNAFIRVRCKRCRSLIEMLPDEVSTVGPPGPFDCDYDPEEIGMRYFRCPECKSTTTLPRVGADDSGDDT
jgi:phage FluMu protein Com